MPTALNFRRKGPCCMLDAASDTDLGRYPLLLLKGRESMGKWGWKPMENQWICVSSIFCCDSIFCFRQTWVMARSAPTKTKNLCRRFDTPRVSQSQRSDAFAIPNMEIIMDHPKSVSSPAKFFPGTDWKLASPWAENPMGKPIVVSQMGIPTLGEI